MNEQLGNSNHCRRVICLPSAMKDSASSGRRTWAFSAEIGLLSQCGFLRVRWGGGPAALFLPRRALWRRAGGRAANARGARSARDAAWEHPEERQVITSSLDVDPTHDYRTNRTLPCLSLANHIIRDADMSVPTSGLGRGGQPGGQPQAGSSSSSSSGRRQPPAGRAYVEDDDPDDNPTTRHAGDQDLLSSDPLDGDLSSRQV